MIRDGIDTGRCHPWKVSKAKPLQRKVEMSFQSLAKLLDHIKATGDYGYLQHLRDPYALMLLLGIKQVVKIDKQGGIPGGVSCEQVWKALNGTSAKRVRDIAGKLVDNEWVYFNQIAAGKHPEGITSEILFQELAQVRQVDFKDAWNTWVVQPDPEAISFALLSDFTSNNAKTGVSRITPAVGRFCEYVQPLGSRYDVRFPCAVYVNHFKKNKGTMYQLHKSAGHIRVFDKNGEKVIDEELGKDDRRQFWPDGVFNIIKVKEKSYSADNHEDILVFDILCLNDVWMHTRPFVERIQFLWRFGFNGVYPTMAYTWEHVKEFGRMALSENLWIRNLNSDYTPLRRDAWIEIGEDEVVQLRVSKRGRGSHWWLKTSDGFNMFSFGDSRIGDKEQGKVVDVDRSGRILRYRFDLKEAMSFDEVSNIWNIYEDDWEVKKIKWRKL